MCVEKHKGEVKIKHSNQNRLLATGNRLLAMTEFPATMTAHAVRMCAVAATGLILVCNWGERG